MLVLNMLVWSFIFFQCHAMTITLMFFFYNLFLFLIQWIKKIFSNCRSCKLSPFLYTSYFLIIEYTIFDVIYLLISCFPLGLLLAFKKKHTQKTLSVITNTHRQIHACNSYIHYYYSLLYFVYSKCRSFLTFNHYIAVDKIIILKKHYLCSDYLSIIANGTSIFKSLCTLNTGAWRRKCNYSQSTQIFEETEVLLQGSKLIAETQQRIILNTFESNHRDSPVGHVNYIIIIICNYVIKHSLARELLAKNVHVGLNNNIIHSIVSGMDIVMQDIVQWMSGKLKLSCIQSIWGAEHEWWK